MIKIKICGITQEKEAEWLNEADVDFDGFIQFYPKSKRNISLQKAVSIMEILSEKIKPVAVTVSPDEDEIKQIEEAGFCYLQIHGNVPDELIENCKIPVLKAFNGNDWGNFAHYLEMKNVAGFVFDAQVPGSGKTFDWTGLEKLTKKGQTLWEFIGKLSEEKIVLLAGGLNRENVADAIKYTGASGVDASSGVENDNGIGKNRNNILEFVKAVRETDFKAVQQAKTDNNIVPTLLHS